MAQLLYIPTFENHVLTKLSIAQNKQFWTCKATSCLQFTTGNKKKILYHSCHLCKFCAVFICQTCHNTAHSILACSNKYEKMFEIVVTQGKNDKNYIVYFISLVTTKINFTI